MIDNAKLPSLKDKIRQLSNTELKQETEKIKEDIKEEVKMVEFKKRKKKE